MAADPVSLTTFFDAPKYPRGLSEESNAGAANVAAIQAMIDAGRTVTIPRDGTYKLTAGLTASGPVHLHFEDGAELDITEAANNAVFLTVEPEDVEGPWVPLTSPTTVGAFALSVASGAQSAVAAGDTVKVASDRNIDPGVTDTNPGELAEVLSTADGVITLRSPLRADHIYDVATDDAAVQKVPMLEGVRITGNGTIRGNPATAAFQKGLVGKRLKSLYIGPGVKFRDVRSMAIQLWDCLNAEIHKPDIEGSNFGNNGYGISYVDACTDCEVFGGSMRKVRHATSLNTSGYGMPRGSRYYGINAYDTIGETFDSHPGSVDTIWYDCWAHDPEANGFHIQCPSAKVVRGGVIGGTSHGMLFHNYTDLPTDWEVDGAIVRRCASNGILFTFTNPGYGETIKRMVIKNATLDRTGVRGIQVTTDGSYQIKNLQVTDNTIIAPGGGSCMRVQYADSPQITGNQGREIDAARHGIHLLNVNKGLIGFNDMEHAALGTGNSIFLEASTRNTLIANNGRGSAAGLYLDADSDDNIIVFGDSADCDAPVIDLGARNTVAPMAGLQQRQPGLIVPTGRMFTNSTLTLIADRLYLGRFVVDRPLLAAHVNFVVTTAASAADACAIALYDESGARIAITATSTSKLNSTGVKGTDFTTPVWLFPGRVYYAGFSSGAQGGTAAVVATARLGTTDDSSILGIGVPNVEIAYQASAHPPPASLGSLTVLNNGAVRMALKQS